MLNNNVNEWYTFDKWTQGVSARLPNDARTSISSPEAVKYDITAAIMISYRDYNDVRDAINKVKTVYKQLFPKKYNNCIDSYPVGDYNQIKQCYPLWRLNDELTDSEFKKLLAFVSI